MQKEPKKKEKNRKPFKLIDILVIVLFLIIIGICLTNIFEITGNYNEASNSYDDLLVEMKNHTSKSTNIETVTNTEEDYEEEVPEYNEEQEQEPETEFIYDHDYLLSINSDAIGWLQVDGLLSYPVVQTNDNEYYLTHLFDGTYNSCGTLFMSSSAEKGINGRAIVIYGHNMRDGSMFGRLHYYEYDDFTYQDEKARLYKKDGMSEYTIVYSGDIPVNSPIFNTGIGDDQLADYIATEIVSDEIISRYGDRPYFLVMSTCTNTLDDDYRFVVIAAKSKPEEEPTSDTENVSETENSVAENMIMETKNSAI